MRRRSTGPVSHSSRVPVATFANLTPMIDLHTHSTFSDGSDTPERAGRKRPTSWDFAPSP